MAHVIFTKNLRLHVDCPDVTVPGGTIREVLDAVFAGNIRLRGYVLDEYGALRKHMNVFVDGRMISDRIGMTDKVDVNSEVHVFQALSGG